MEPGDIESYEPPQLIVVGSLPALTGGAAGADTDVGTSSVD
jgi:hypothetical protein